MMLRGHSRSERQVVRHHQRGDRQGGAHERGGQAGQPSRTVGQVTADPAQRVSDEADREDASRDRGGGIEETVWHVLSFLIWTRCLRKGKLQPCRN